MKSTPFMEIDDKGRERERECTKILKALGERLRFRHGQWTKREQH
jgi:hypothetical protein